MGLAYKAKSLAAIVLHFAAQVPHAVYSSRVPKERRASQQPVEKAVIPAPLPGSGSQCFNCGREKSAGRDC